MKRIAALLLLVAFGFAIPVYASRTTHPRVSDARVSDPLMTVEENTRQSRKAEKKQMKAMKKYEKAQHKAGKKAQRQSGFHRSYR
jgi:Flp pilus assembly protein TadB